MSNSPVDWPLYFKRTKKQKVTVFQLLNLAFHPVYHFTVFSGPFRKEGRSMGTAYGKTAFWGRLYGLLITQCPFFSETE